VVLSLEKERRLAPEVEMARGSNDGDPTVKQG